MGANCEKCKSFGMADTVGFFRGFSPCRVHTFGCLAPQPFFVGRVDYRGMRYSWSYLRSNGILQFSEDNGSYGGRGDEGQASRIL